MVSDALGNAILLLALLAGCIVVWIYLCVSQLRRVRSISDFLKNLKGLESLRSLILKALSWNMRLRFERTLVHAGLLNWRVADLALMCIAFAAAGGFVGFMIGRSWWAILLGVIVLSASVKVWLRQKIQRHEAHISQHLPMFLDLLCLCLGAGMSFNLALVSALRYCPAGPLRVLWQDWLFDIRSGSTRIDALNRLRLRSAQLSLQRLCVAMIQTEKTGAALVASLRSQSKQLRLDQWIAAERRAAQAPMKMLLPLIVCFFPSTFLVLMFSIWVGVREAL